jgi:membrane-bound ClpP family serine protease
MKPLYVASMMMGMGFIYLSMSSPHYGRVLSVTGFFLVVLGLVGLIAVAKGKRMVEYYRALSWSVMAQHRPGRKGK